MSLQTISDYLLEGVNFISSELKLTRSQVVDFLFPDPASRPVGLTLTLCSEERIKAEESVRGMIANGFWHRSSFWECSSHIVRGTNWARTYAKTLTKFPVTFYNRMNGWEQDPAVYNALYALVSQWQSELSCFKTVLAEQDGYGKLRDEVVSREEKLAEAVGTLRKHYRSRLIYDPGNGFRAHVPTGDGHEDTQSYRDVSRFNIAKPLQKIFDQSISFKLVQYGETEVAQKLAFLRRADSLPYNRKSDDKLLRIAGHSRKNQNLLMEIIVRIWLVRILKEMGWRVDLENSVCEIGERTVLHLDGAGMSCEIMKGGVIDLDLLKELRRGEADANGFQPDVVLLFSKNCGGVRRGFMVIADSKNYKSSSHDVADRAMILYLMAFHRAMGLDLLPEFPETDDEKAFYPFKFDKYKYAFDFGMLFFPSIKGGEGQRRLISHFQLNCLSCCLPDSHVSGCEVGCPNKRLHRQLEHVKDYLATVEEKDLPLFYDETKSSHRWQYRAD